MELLLEAGGRLDDRNLSGQAPLDVTSASFAALFEFKLMAQTKSNENKKEKLSPLKTMATKNGQTEGHDNKSTNMESANTITKSIFSSKTVEKPNLRSQLDQKTSKSIVFLELEVSAMFTWSKRKTPRGSMQ
jgi:hypothetical protein